MDVVEHPLAAAPARRGLVVDWGGVLTPSLDVAMARWARDDRVEYEHFREVLRSWSGPPDRGEAPARADPSGSQAEADEAEPVAALEQATDDGPAATSPVHLLERGELTPAEFERRLAGELARRGSPVGAQGLLERMLGGLEPLEDDMIGMIRRIRSAGVGTALLSNSWGEHYPQALWDGLFDAVVISGRVRMRKPDAEIFLHTAALLGLPAQQCVMVDDLPRNVRAAVGVGMVGVLHRSYAETVAELEVLLDLPLR